MIDHVVSTCEKCQEVFPTTIHGCSICRKIIGKSRGYEIINIDKHLCFECYQNLEENAGMDK